MIESTDYVHIGRCDSEYPMRLQGYIPKEAAVLQSIHDNLFYQSMWGPNGYARSIRKILPGKAKTLLGRKQVIHTKPWLLLPCYWPAFVEGQQRFEEGKVKFFWEILPERSFGLGRGQDFARFYETREQAEAFFMPQCELYFGYAASDAEANGEISDAEHWRQRTLVIERTETRTWMGCDRDEHDRGDAFGFLTRREMNISG